jgi:glutathione S-transferase
MRKTIVGAMVTGRLVARRDQRPRSVRVASDRFWPNTACRPAMEVAMMKLYGAPPTRALRVIWLLNELGLEYEMLPVDVLQGENQQQEKKSDCKDVDLARQECVKMVAVLERHMQDREFMVGDRLSVADFNAAYTLDWANEEKMLDGHRG